MGTQGSIDETELFEFVQAVMGTRSPYTVIKRGSALSAFVKWMHVHLPHTLGKVVEAYAWEYVTLPETNMEAQNGPYKDYSPFKGRLYGFPC